MGRNEAMLHREEAYSIIKEYMEPVLVRKGAELPPAGHMYSYLTIGLIAEQPLTPQMRKAIRHFKYEKGYRFNIRGNMRKKISVCRVLFTTNDIWLTDIECT